VRDIGDEFHAIANRRAEAFVCFFCAMETVDAGRDIAKGDEMGGVGKAMGDGFRPKE
jgi:hypothetical protein